MAVERYDLFAFETPAGEREITPNAISFFEHRGADWAGLVIFKSSPSSGDANRDLQEAWNRTIQRPGLSLAGPVNSESGTLPTEWLCSRVSSLVRSPQGMQLTALLYSFVGHGRRTGVACYYTEPYFDRVQRFIDSLEIDTPANDAASSGQANAASRAPGLVLKAPPEFKEKGAAFIADVVDGPRVNGVSILVPDALKSGGAMDDALRNLWRVLMPPAVANSASALVFRRFVGERIPARFIAGVGKLPGEQAEWMFTLYLLDCDKFWQPLAVVQSYREPGVRFPIAADMMAGLSVGTTLKLVERFFAGVACPASKKRPLVDATELAGDYTYGSFSALQWVHRYTGSTAMTSVAFSGTLRLDPDGRFEYTFQGAGGQVGALNFATDSSRGRWELDSDLLRLHASEGRDRLYRFAGLTHFPTKEKVAILLMDTEARVDPTSVNRASDYYTAKTG